MLRNIEQVTEVKYLGTSGKSKHIICVIIPVTYCPLCVEVFVCGDEKHLCCFVKALLRTVNTN